MRFTFAMQIETKMIRIDTKKDPEQSLKKTHYARCPVCNQILLDVEHSKGIIETRVLCRRCRTYVKVEIVGN